MIVQKKLKLEITISFFFLINVFSFSQNIIKGRVYDEYKNPISIVSVVAKNKLDSIINYTFTNDKGEYVLNVKKHSIINILFSSLGYEKSNLVLNIKNSKTINNVFLKEKEFKLNEVIIEYNKAITVKNDTIIFRVSRFLNKNDQNVEDLLKNVPGINIDSEGKIKVGNVEIEKLMIDGDDFFGRGYKILSKNMPPDQIDKIELLQKYSNNKLLKNVEQSDKVALNLVLKKNVKRKWFGNFSLGYDVTFKNRYSLKSYLMNFSKKK